MAYTRRFAGGFVDKPTLTTPIDSTFLNAVETALLELVSADGTADGQVMSWIAASSKFGPALLLNKNVDPAAAIAKSKLDLSGANGIVNADVATAAAIARSKLDFGSGLVNADISASAAIALSKLADPTTGKVIGSAAGAAASVFPPGYEIAVVEQTTTTTTASTTLVDLVTFPAATFEATKYYFEMVLSNVRHSVALASIVFQLMEGAATVGTPAQLEMAGTAGNGVVCVLRIPFTPTAASHTYKVQWKTAAAGTITLVATSLAAGEFRIVKA